MAGWLDEREVVVNPLTDVDYDLIFESLRYTRDAFVRYDRYPSEDFRAMRIAAVDIAVEHLRLLQQTEQK